MLYFTPFRSMTCHFRDTDHFETGAQNDLERYKVISTAYMCY